MLKYQLFFFEDLIKQDIRPQLHSKTKLDKDFYSSTISEVKFEKEQILNNLVDNLFNLQNEDGAGLYIQLHQHNLVALLDLVAEDLGNEHTNGNNTISQAVTWANLYKHIYSTLCEILAFIEEKFAKHLDINCKVPVYYLTAAPIISENI